MICVYYRVQETLSAYVRKKWKKFVLDLAGFVARSQPNKQSLEYVRPSDPQTGASILLHKHSLGGGCGPGHAWEPEST